MLFFETQRVKSFRMIWLEDSLILETPEPSFYITTT